MQSNTQKIKKKKKKDSVHRAVDCVSSFKKKKIAFKPLKPSNLTTLHTSGYATQTIPPPLDFITPL